MGRCVTTANAILEGARGIENVTDNKAVMEAGFVRHPSLRERHFGHWQGKTKNHIFATFAKEVEADRSGDWSTCAKGGESRLQVLQRVIKGLADICAKHKEKDRILVVTHGGVMSILSVEILRGHDMPYKRKFQVPNTSLTVVDAVVMGTKLALSMVSLADVGHLQRWVPWPHAHEQQQQQQHNLDKEQEGEQEEKDKEQPQEQEEEEEEEEEEAAQQGQQHRSRREQPAESSSATTENANGGKSLESADNPTSS